MAVSKVILNNEVLMDVTNDTVASDNLLTSYQATGANGETVLGAFDTSKFMPIVDYGEKTLIFDTTTVSFTKDGDNDWYVSAENPISGFTKNDFAYDREYIVTWDGVEYVCYAGELRKATATGAGIYEWCAIGNASSLGYGGVASQEFPFLIEYDFYRDAGEVQFFAFNSLTSHTVKLEYRTFSVIAVNPVLYMDTIKGFPLIQRGTGEASTMEGGAIATSGIYSHAEGTGTIASGNCAHAQGKLTVASGNYSFAGGSVHSALGKNEASGDCSFAYGLSAQATGQNAFSLGQGTLASAVLAFATGDRTVASGVRSFTGGDFTVANHRAQLAFGQYNIADTSEAAATARGNYVEIIGNGTADNARSNARTLDWNGNEWLAGTITAQNIPAPPTTDGAYILKCTVSSGVATYEWTTSI